MTNPLDQDFLNEMSKLNAYTAKIYKIYDDIKEKIDESFKEEMERNFKDELDTKLRELFENDNQFNVETFEALKDKVNQLIKERK